MLHNEWGYTLDDIDGKWESEVLACCLYGLRL